MRLWIQAALAVISLLIGTIGVGGTVLAVRVVAPDMAAVLFASDGVLIAFGFGVGLAAATALEALAKRKNARDAGAARKGL